MAYGCQTQGLWAPDPSLLGLAWPQTPGTWVWDGRQIQGTSNILYTFNIFFTFKKKLILTRCGARANILLYKKKSEKTCHPCWRACRLL
jgi:hypothetical protein